MKVLFISLVEIKDLETGGIYHDLLRKFHQEGHELYIVYPSERRNGSITKLIKRKRLNILSVGFLNIQKTNVIEKSIATLIISLILRKGILRYYNKIKFDLILYPTPPITFRKVISFIKERDSAKTYLLLKDIWPQAAVDLGIIKKNSLFYRYLANEEKLLYKISDYIGCCSPANELYLRKNNPDLKSLIEVNPNSIQIDDLSSPRVNKRAKYNIPIGKTVFIYGGNLGRPQGIDFLIDIILSNRSNPSIFFLIVGSGTEFLKIQKFLKRNAINNTKLIKYLPKQEYEDLVYSSDVGLIFLDPRFTIPNIPSRLLSYLENKKPVIAATDRATDLGSIIETNGFGFWCENGDLMKYNKILKNILKDDETIKSMGKRGNQYLRENYTVELSYNKILRHFE